MDHHLDEGGAALGGGSPTQKIQSPTINTSSIPVIITLMINPLLIVFSPVHWDYDDCQIERNLIENTFLPL